jgi:hypothetical protein
VTRTIAAALAATALAGCASLNNVESDVSSFSRWPAGRTPSTYAFERLPSQQANPQQAQVLEDTARRAVESAGFVPAPEGSPPDVTVQIGARVTAYEVAPWDDPFWYGGPLRLGAVRLLGPAVGAALGSVRRPVLGAVLALRLSVPDDDDRARGRGPDPRPQERRAALRSTGAQRRQLGRRPDRAAGDVRRRAARLPVGSPTNPHRVVVEPPPAP